MTSTDTSKAVTDIDDIWESMKNASFNLTSSKKTENLASLWEAPSSKQIKKENVIVGVQTATNTTVPNHCVLSRKCIENQPSPEVKGITLVIPKEVPTPSLVLIGDSDDETDDEYESELEGTENENLRLERCASLLKSESLKDRLETVEKLHKSIESFCAACKKIRPLDLPPPYDFNRITLTHRQQGLVSDLAKGEHVADWGPWQRTQVSLLAQFDNDDPGRQEENTSHQDSTSKPISKDHNDRLDQLQSILNVCGTSIFLLFADKSETCRSRAISCVRMLSLCDIDMGRHLPYLLPVIFSRYPPQSYDHEMQLFVDDIDDHELYKRGGAVMRQDQIEVLKRNRSMKVVEPSEEVRLMMCELVTNIIWYSIQTGRTTMIEEYYTSIVLALQCHLRDSFSDIKVLASNTLVQLLRVSQLELGAKYFATGIARSTIANMRHRNAKVRFASLQLFEAAVSAPDREKVKGAGTQAIHDLVGFREENVLPIGAFYTSECGVTVNTLAELAVDKNVRVRHKCCQMLGFLITCLPDRYDHHQKLLPYLLSFINDSHLTISDHAIRAIEICGQHHESENPDDVIERRQYGVDGDERCNYDDPLPAPFKIRPRLGARMFIRNNTKGFFGALLSELSCWISKTRNLSAKLVLIMSIYCEEHLTMDFHKTCFSIVKAIRVTIRDGNNRWTFQRELEHILEIMGRYVDPATYIPLLLPRALGDSKSATTFSDGGVHSAQSRIANSIALRAMMKGSLSHRLIPHVFDLIPQICDPHTLGFFSGTQMKMETLSILLTFFERVKGQSVTGAQSAHFQAKGRICDSCKVIENCKNFLFEIVDGCDEQEVHERATKVLQLLPDI